MPFRFGLPLAANPRMEDPFKRAFPNRVAEYYRSKFLSIQVASVGKHALAKLSTNFLLQLRQPDECVCSLIGIEKSRARQDFTETFAERAFTRGNPASDSDGRHELDLSRTKVCSHRQQSVAKTVSFAMSEMRVSCRAYDGAGFSRKNRLGIWGGEQAQHCVGDRQGMGCRGCAPDVQLSRRTVERKRGGTGRRIWRENSIVSLRRFQRR